MSGGDARERPFGWPPGYRIRARREILPVQRGGSRRSGRWLTLCCRSNDVGHLRLAMAVSKKVGHAVARNRVKRILRDVFRHLADDVGGVDIVVLARPSLVGKAHSEVEREIHRLLGDDLKKAAR